MDARPPLAHTFSPAARMPPPSCDHASRLLARLEAAHTSPTVLFYLRLPPSMLRLTELGQLLLDLLDALGVPLPALDDAFFSAVDRAAQLRCVAGSFFKVEKTKEGAIHSFRKELLRRRARRPQDPFLYMGATMPVCFQTLRGRTGLVKEHSDSLFVVHSSPENALHHAVEMLRAGHYVHGGSLVPVEQVYELRLHDAFLEGAQGGQRNRLAYIILDWEVKESEVEGRLTRDELAALCAEFPLWFYQRMVERGHVPRKAVVFATVKQKTRDIPGAADRKHSTHTVFHVCGVPSTHLQAICRDVLGDDWRELKKFKDKNPDVRATAFVDAKTGEDRIGRSPHVGLDAAPFPGTSGVAMLFSRKAEADPYPGLEHTCAFSDGRVHVFPMGVGADGRPAFSVPNPCPFDPPAVGGQHDLGSLTQQQAVRLMYAASCSVPKVMMVAPTQASRENAEVLQSRTAARHRATSESGVAPPAHGGAGSAPVSSAPLLPDLPEWFRSYVRRMNGKETPTAATRFAENIRRLGLEGCDPSLWRVTHYHPGVPCPKLLSDPAPVLHFHTNNGVIIASHPHHCDAVFVRCTHCSSLAQTNDDVERVRGGHHDQATDWIKLTEDGFKRVIEKAAKKVVQTGIVQKMAGKVCQEHKRKEMDIQNSRAKKIKNER